MIYKDMEGEKEMEDQLCIMHEQQKNRRDGIVYTSHSGKNERHLEARMVANVWWTESGS